MGVGCTPCVCRSADLITVHEAALFEIVGTALEQVDQHAGTLALLTLNYAQRHCNTVLGRLVPELALHNQGRDADHRQ